jgi:hypothetical protein
VSGEEVAGLGEVHEGEDGGKKRRGRGINKAWVIEMALEKMKAQNEAIALLQ